MVSLLFHRPSSPDLRDPQSGLFLTFYAIVFVSGFRRYAEDLEMMLGKKPNIWFRICWMVITPAVLFVSLNFQFMHKTKMWCNSQM